MVENGQNRKQPNPLPHSNLFKFTLALCYPLTSTEHRWSHMDIHGRVGVLAPMTITATTERSAELKHLPEPERFSNLPTCSFPGAFYLFIGFVFFQQNNMFGSKAGTIQMSDLPDQHAVAARQLWRETVNHLVAGIPDLDCHQNLNYDWSACHLTTGFKLF